MSNTQVRTLTAAGSTRTDRLLVLAATAAMVAGAAPVAEAAQPRSGGYDLVVTQVQPTSAGTQAIGAAVTFQATIHNRGTAPTPAGVVHGVAFSVDGRVVSWSDTHVTSLAPGASTTVVANGGPVGRATWGATAGTHALVAYVDDVNRMRGESNESNNRRSATVDAAAVKPVTAVSARPAMTEQEFVARHGKDVVVSWQVPTDQPVGTHYVLTEHPADTNAGICDPSSAVEKTSTTAAQATVTMTTGTWCYGHTFGNRVAYSVEARAGGTTATSGRSGVCEWSNAFDTYGGGSRTWQLSCDGSATLTHVEGPSMLAG